MKKLQDTERSADTNEVKISDLLTELESNGETAARRRSVIKGELAKLESASTIDSYFEDPKVAKYVKDVAEELRSDPQGGGRYIGFGDAHVILIDPDAGKNELDTAMIVAHELGHALYSEQLASTLQNPRSIIAYLKRSKKHETPKMPPMLTKASMVLKNGMRIKRLTGL